ncbi:NAD(P)H-binding protein [Geobacillus jurassicus]|uniref:NAD(P)H-binding protein n=1 Tax=Geobacillus jurassicus TaxID=235932 RepID=A0ABV6GP20_9BACL|nr:NAD(P)H-binding protein [Geobacillus jurassicus]
MFALEVLALERRTALLLGASGLVGGELLKLLLQSDLYCRVTIFVRTPLPVEHEKLQQVVVDFARLESYERHFYVDDVFCCLGTTRKKAKTKQQFIQVDYEYTLRAAVLAEKCRAKSFLTVSSIGANPCSPFFYQRVKGETEEALQRLSIPSLHIFRPSLLVGKRREFRLAEALAGWLLCRLSFLFVGKWKKYKPVDARQLALAMFYRAASATSGVHIYECDELARIS